MNDKNSHFVLILSAIRFGDYNIDKDKVEEILKKSNVNIENDNVYDATYVMNMARADYMKSSISDDEFASLYDHEKGHLARQI